MKKFSTPLFSPTTNKNRGTKFPLNSALKITLPFRSSPQSLRESRRFHRLVGLLMRNFTTHFNTRKWINTRCWVVWVVFEGHGCESIGGIDGKRLLKVAQTMEFPSEFPPAEAQRPLPWRIGQEFTK